jgi:hypothetical protein
VDPAHYPAHHQLALWLHHRPLEAANAMRDIFDDVDEHARLWILMAFIPSSLPPPAVFPRSALNTLEELTARYAEENEKAFLHGVERGALHALGAAACLPLGVRYVQACEVGFPLFSSLLTFSKDSPDKFALMVRLLSPLGWLYPREALHFLDDYVAFGGTPPDPILETYANMRLLHPGVVDAHLQERGADRTVQQRIKTSADLEQVTYRAHMISTHDVRVTSIILNSPYGRWLTDCVLLGYLEAKTPKEAARRFGDGLFEALRGCDWHMKRLFAVPD